MSSKKKSAGEAAPKKKASGAKKAAPKKAAKPAAKKPSKKKAEEKIEKIEAAEAPIVEAIEEKVETSPEVADVIEAEIIAETPAGDITDENEAVEPAVELSEEERELSSIYGEDLDAPARAHTEYQDRQTRDEDRPMLPEINAREERRNRWEERREARKRRRDERQQRREQHQAQRGDGRPHGDGRPQEQRPHGDGRGQEPRAERPPFQPRPVEIPAPTNGHAPEGLARVGTPLGDAAAAVFAQLRNGQPLPVRQLAAMMRKRSLVNQDPEQLWPQLKAELLGDERSYRTLGLRPRIVYRGRDLFAPGPVAMSVTADAEAGVASALSKLASATHRALASRLAKASPAGFERIIHAYLVAAGYRDIEWVKRVGGISYASATAPGLSRTVLVSARSGAEPIDRRGIGELRVGVEAKDLVAGILMTPGELSEDAERELERAGRSIAVINGDQLVAALINAGVGVVTAAAPVHYLDDQLLEEILAG